MKLAYISMWRSIPAWIMYSRSGERQQIDQDMQVLGYPPSLLSLHQLLYRNGNCFRNLFYSRTVKGFPLLTKASKLLLRPMFGLEIDVEDGIGGGMVIYHGYSTIICAKAIGKNFRVYQNVTIGRGKTVNGINNPTIGDDVTIYTGAVVVGGICIGDRAVIGAGAVVTKDVPPDTTVVGARNRML